MDSCFCPENVSTLIVNTFEYLNDVHEFIVFHEKNSKVIINDSSYIYIRKESTSEIINMRDVLIHYISYYRAYKDKNFKECGEQFAFIVEHLQRGMKDQLIFFFQEILLLDLKKWEEIAEKAGNIALSQEIFRLIQKIKNTILTIRVSNANGIKIVDKEIRDIFKDIRIDYAKIFDELQLQYDSNL